MHQDPYICTISELLIKFVFTPKHKSWLNMIESFFSKMTKQMLHGIRVNTKQKLEERIYQYFEGIDQSRGGFELLPPPVMKNTTDG